MSDNIFYTGARMTSRPQSPQQVNRPKQLVVEGRSCQVFLEAFLKNLGLTSQVQDFRGKEDLHGWLAALRRMPGFSTVTSLGVVRDADANPEGAFDSVCSALEHSRLPVPSQPLLAAGPKPTVSVLILPDAHSRGDLEALCLRGVEQDAAMRCINGFFECLSGIGLTPRQTSKAKVQAFLASRERTVWHLGEAANRGYWPFDQHAFDGVREFLKAL